MDKKTINVILAAERLLKKLDEIHDNESYKGIWTFAFVHGVSYDGPTSLKETKALRKALKKIGRLD